MAHGLPAAIGAQVAHPRALVIYIAGEASIQMNVQELATAVQHPADLDGVITEMIDTPGPVVVDCEVVQLANCFPMIPAEAAHDEMVLAS